ncbi:MAG TPA: ABC transporter permease [Thermoanaerobaculia bacterium]|nr:ABC transporter permease [Thermoanaerobaculia bacterium]
MDGTGAFDRLLQDLRYGGRQLRKSPTFTAVAVTALALGLGANAALWTMVRSVLLRPLPYARPERLVVVQETFLPSGWGPASPANFHDWRVESHSFSVLVPFVGRNRNLQGGAPGGEPERVHAVLVGARLWRALGVPPLLGTVFPPEADRAGSPAVAMLSESLWRRRFNGDRAVIGRPVKLDDEWFTVVGVMPETFQFPPGGGTVPPGTAATEVWLPLRFTAREQEVRGNHYVSVVGRLRPGVTPAAAQADLQAIARRYVAAKLEDEGRSVQVVPLQEAVVRAARPVLLTLTGAVAFILLIACANVANLLLARAAHRRREVAVRGALGAGRARLVRQFLVESLLLALLSGAVGLLVARAGVQLLSRFAAANLPRAAEAHLDGSVLGLLFAACLVTAVGFGLAPALAASRVDPLDGLREGAGRGGVGSGHRQRRLRSALVVAELALALMLLVGAGLMLRTLWNLQGTNPGFVTEDVLTLHLSAPARRYAGRELGAALYRPVLERARALPGVREAGWVDALPLQNWGINGDFAIEGRPPARAGEKPFAEVRSASPGYFEALGIRRLAGRDFADRDDRGAPRVAVINRELARRYFARENPLGRRIGWPEEKMWFTIVGVVDDVREARLSRPPAPQWYLSYLQAQNEWIPEMTLVVRGQSDPGALTRPLIAAVREVDPEQPVFNVKPMERILAESVSDSRLSFVLLSLFAALAVALAAAGIYGVMSYLVAERTREMGMRMALGAGRRDLYLLVFRQALPQIAGGVLLGLAGSLALSRLLRVWLFGVAPTDPQTFAAVTVGLVGVALAAVYLPSRRAARVDPMVALRAE